MNELTRHGMDQIVTISVFAFIFSIFLIAVIVWALWRAKKTQQLQRRLKLGQEEPLPDRTLSLWHNGQMVTTMVPRLAMDKSLSSRARQRLAAADLYIQPAMAAVALLLVAGAIFALLAVMTNSILAGVAGAAGVFMAAWWIVTSRTEKMAKLFDQQFVEALDLMSRSLRAGHPLSGSIHLISEEIEPPVGTVFLAIYQEQNMGIGLEEAVRNGASTCPQSDMRLFAASATVQMRSGGNLADMMDRLAHVVRERIRIKRRFRVLTAQTQFSKRVLLVMPVLLFLILNIVNPNYTKPLYTTTVGQIMLGVGGSLFVLGIVVMNRLSRIDV